MIVPKLKCRYLNMHDWEYRRRDYDGIKCTHKKCIWCEKEKVERPVIY